MEVELEFAGVEIVPKTPRERARELAALTAALSDCIAAVAEGDLYLSPEIEEAAVALRRAYAQLGGVFGLFELAPAKRVRQAPELGALLAAAAVAEARFLAAVARHRAGWLYEWLRENPPEGARARPAVEGG